MADMVKKQILPAVLKYEDLLSESALRKQKLAGAPSAELETELLKKLSSLSACLYKKTAALEQALVDVKSFGDIKEEADFYKDHVFAAMQETRAVADELETMVGEEYWPYPTYDKLLFHVG